MATAIQDLTGHSENAISINADALFRSRSMKLNGVSMI